LADYRMYATWAVLATHCSVFFLIGFLLVRRLDRCTRLPLVVSLPVVWTAMEFARSNLFGGFATLWLGNAQHDLPGGFAWYFLGHTQHAFLPIIQIADLGGAYGVTLLVAAVNAMIFELLATQTWFRTFFALRPAVCSVQRQAIAAALLFASTLGYGLW